jgi:hypothetical protein
LQAVASYTYGRANDTTSTLSGLDRADQLAPAAQDLRHNFNAGLSWALPEVKRPSVEWLLSGWEVDAIASARSGYPFSVLASTFVVPGTEAYTSRASLVPGVPIVLKDTTVPGGEVFNAAAFVDPPLGEQGNTGKNQFRGLAASKFDIALQRSFSLFQGATLRLRCDAFNIFNSPVFSLPVTVRSSSLFGHILSTTATGVNGLYQYGSPRTVAFSTRIEF